MNTLIDDVVNGKVKITLQNGIIYKSMEIKKTSLISNKCQIIFEKEEIS